MGGLRLSRSLLIASSPAAILLGMAAYGCSQEADAPPSNFTVNTTSGASGVTGTSAAAAGPVTGGGPVTSSTSSGGPFGTTTGGSGTTGSVTNSATASTGAGGGSATAAVNTAGTTGGPPGDCGITVDSYDISSAISTVGIVTWSATASIDSAEIQFGPADTGFTLSAPVDLAEPEYRTLLLGMKGEREYQFQVVASSGGQTCTSETYTLQTGPIPNNIPSINRQVMNEAAVAPGFLVTSGGIGGMGGGGGGAPAFIFDHEGDVVWWATAPSQCSRARMDWEGKNMWMLSLNVQNGGGEMRRVSMDGLDAENNVQGLNQTHHDFTVVPGGIVAAISWVSSGMDVPSNILERSPDGSIKTAVTLDQSIYQNNSYHANAITYIPSDESYVVSDRNPNLYVKVSRQGQLIWQFGGSNPVGPFISGGDWQVNHGHHLLENGNLLIFNNGGGFGGGSSPAIEFQLDLNSMMATEIWRYTSNSSSPTLGDVQRLPNGNTLVTYSNSGVIHEVDGSQNLVQSFTIGSAGYVIHRPTLYGPPPK